MVVFMAGAGYSIRQRRSSTKADDIDVGGFADVATAVTAADASSARSTARSWGELARELDSVQPTGGADDVSENSHAHDTTSPLRPLSLAAAFKATHARTECDCGPLSHRELTSAPTKDSPSGSESTRSVSTISDESISSKRWLLLHRRERLLAQRARAERMGVAHVSHILECSDSLSLPACCSDATKDAPTAASAPEPVVEPLPIQVQRAELQKRYWALASRKAELEASRAARQATTAQDTDGVSARGYPSTHPVLSPTSTPQKGSRAAALRLHIGDFAKGADGADVATPLRSARELASPAVKDGPSGRVSEHSGGVAIDVKRALLRERTKKLKSNIGSPYAQTPPRPLTPAHPTRSPRVATPLSQLSPALKLRLADVSRMAGGDVDGLMSARRERASLVADKEGPGRIHRSGGASRALSLGPSTVTTPIATPPIAATPRVSTPTVATPTAAMPTATTPTAATPKPRSPRRSPSLRYTPSSGDTAHSASWHARIEERRQMLALRRAKLEAARASHEASDSRSSSVGDASGARRQALAKRRAAVVQRRLRKQGESPAADLDSAEDGGEHTVRPLSPRSSSRKGDNKSATVRV